MKRKERESKYDTAALIPTIKRKISNDTSQNLNILTTSLSDTLEVDSISLDKGLTSFWTESSKAWSQKLWSHTRTDCVDLSSLKDYSKSARLNSWFAVNNHHLKKNMMTQENSQMMMSSLSLQSLWQNITENVQPTTKKEEPKKPPKKLKQRKSKSKKPKKERKPKKTPAQKAIKIKLYPSKEERDKLNQWMGTARWTYNRCLEIYNNRVTKSELKKLKKRTTKDEIGMVMKDMRTYIVNNIHYREENQWVLNTPYMIRDAAARELVTAFKGNFTKLRQGIQDNFFIRFKRRKDRKDSILISCRNWLSKKGEFSFLKNIKSSEPLPDDLKYDSRIIKTKLGEYYLCIPKPLDMRSENQAPESTLGVVALDPGVRTFQTTFDLNSMVTEWGKGDYTRIGRLCHAYDKIQSKWSQPQVNHNKRYKYKKAGLRIQKQIRNLVSDLHKKLCLWLCQSYRVILLPEFATQHMVKRAYRKISSKTARAMLTWSHYSFKQRLLHKSREFPWCNVYIVNEAYTSKTCTHCGYIHHHLGGAKEFHCPRCHSTIDRDHNGARNILLRFLTKHNIN